VAQATLLVDRKGPQVVKIQQVLSESFQSDEHSYYETQYEMLRSRSLAAEVIKAQDLDKNPAFTGDDARKSVFSELRSAALGWLNSLSSRPIPATNADVYGVSPKLIDAYQGMLQIEPLKRSRLVRIGISASDPVLAANMANAHALAYVQQGPKLGSQANEEAQKFLEAKLGDLQDRVQQSEDALNRFRRGKGIIALNDKENIVVERLADLNKRLTEAEADRVANEAHARLVKQRDYDSLPAVISNQLIQNLRAQVVQQESEHAKLAAQFLPGYPRLAQLKAQLEETKSRLAQQINSVVEGINSAYFAALAKERALRHEMEKQKSAALALKDASVEYAILAREADTNKQLYDSVLERFKEVNVVGEIPSSNVSIIDRAEIPSGPSEPRKALNLMLSALLGLMGGLGLAVLLEYSDKTLRTPEEVERFLGVLSLAVVPDLFSVSNGGPRSHATQTSRAQGDLVLPKKRSLPSERRIFVVTEAYRRLRTAIFLSRSADPARTLLFTSATPGEGKTITVVNTAIMFARLGHRVLLIDADLRRPACHKALNVNSLTGLSNYLAGHEQLDNTVQATPIDNLSVINCGTIPQAPTELIGSQKMAEALNLLGEHYDIILIDSPPVMPVSDAVVLSSLVERIIFVVRAQKTPKNFIKEAIAQLATNQSKILGVVLNRVDIRSPEYKDCYNYYNPEYYYSLARSA
jgi:capsular exopolysaccharide synthesis family protein